MAKRHGVFSKRTTQSYLLVEQLAEIIFTFFTVKLEPAAEEPDPLDADEPAAPVLAAELSELLPIIRT